MANATTGSVAAEAYRNAVGCADTGASPHAAGDCSCSCPSLVRLGLEQMADTARLPGSKMIPRTHALRACLALKLWAIERKSHVMALVADEGLGLFCGLNRIPKKSYLSEYSSRTTPKHTSALLGAWHTGVLAEQALFPAQSFDLDFHSVPYHGAHPSIERHYVSKRPRVLLRRCQPAQGRGAPSGIPLPRVLETHPWCSRRQSSWRRIRLDVPARKYRTPRVWEKYVQLAGCRLRQLYILDLGHDQPTVLVTNDTRTPKTLITRYAQRMLIENAICDAVRFFHIDALSSAVAMKVDFDMTLLVIASGLYRRLAQRMRGYAECQARQIFRDLIDMPADVTITEREVEVRFHRRAHLPIIAASGLLDEPVTVPWWNGMSLRMRV